MKKYLNHIFKGDKTKKTILTKLGGKTVFCAYYYNEFGWFRIFGRGLTWKNTRKHPLMFSERYGFSKGLTIGKWYVSVLKPPLKKLSSNPQK